MKSLTPSGLKLSKRRNAPKQKSCTRSGSSTAASWARVFWIYLCKCNNCLFWKGLLIQLRRNLIQEKSENIIPIIRHHFAEVSSPRWQFTLARTKHLHLVTHLRVPTRWAGQRVATATVCAGRDRGQAWQLFLLALRNACHISLRLRQWRLPGQLRLTLQVFCRWRLRDDKSSCQGNEDCFVPCGWCFFPYMIPAILWRGDDYRLLVQDMCACVIVVCVIFFLCLRVYVRVRFFVYIMHFSLFWRAFDEGRPCADDDKSLRKSETSLCTQWAGKQEEPVCLKHHLRFALCKISLCRDTHTHTTFGPSVTYCFLGLSLFFFFWFVVFLSFPSFWCLSSSVPKFCCCRNSACIWKTAFFFAFLLEIFFLAFRSFFLHDFCMRFHYTKETLDMPTSTHRINSTQPMMRRNNLFVI